MNAIQSSLIAIALSLFLFSCNTSDNNAPQIPMADLELTIALDGTKVKITDIKTGEVTTDIDYNMGNITSLIYVVHDATTGKFGKALNLPKEMVSQYVKDGVATLHNLLPFGNYYITMIATTQNYMENVLLANGLSKDYTQAICQLPNEHIYYATYRVDCMPPYGQLPSTTTEDINFKLSAELNRMTGEYTLVSDVKKIPTTTNFSLVFDIKDVPSAIFLASGKTITEAEGKANNIKRFSKLTTTQNISVSNLTSVLGKVYLLQNDNLPPSERGSIAFTYKENKASAIATRFYEEDMPERTSINNSNTTFISLYDPANVEYEENPIGE